MRLFVRWLLPLVLAFAVTQQGCHYAFILGSTKSDLGVLAGVILGLASVAAFFSFVFTWFRKPVLDLVEYLKDNNF